MRWVSLGDSGTSGTLQCVVKEPASEHEPRTELYIAETLRHRKGKRKAERWKIQANFEENRITNKPNWLILTVRGSLLLASGLSGGTPTLPR